MATYIQINRIDDGPDLAIYEFGPVDKIVGQVGIDKKTGEVVVLSFAPDATVLPLVYFQSRVTRKLSHHREAGEYPLKTHYAT